MPLPVTGLGHGDKYGLAAASSRGDYLKLPEECNAKPLGKSGLLSARAANPSRCCCSRRCGGALTSDYSDASESWHSARYKNGLAKLGWLRDCRPDDLQSPRTSALAGGHHFPIALLA
jgi:hypothetical protein